MSRNKKKDFDNKSSDDIILDEKNNDTLDKEELHTTKSMIEKIAQENNTIAQNIDEKIINHGAGGTIQIDLTDCDLVEFETAATGQKSKQKTEGKNIRLLSGRIYKLPVNNKTIDSDLFNILKVYSNSANRIDVRYVKNGYACVIPLQHGVILKHDEHLCSIFN